MMSKVNVENQMGLKVSRIYCQGRSLIFIPFISISLFSDFEDLNTRKV